MRGGSESDLLLGGPGNDNLEGRGAPDVLDGGEDLDTVLYVLRTATQPVEVTLDGAANDGGAEDGHADHILANVEDVNATPGDDTLVGNAGANRMLGGEGPTGSPAAGRPIRCSDRAATTPCSAKPETTPSTAAPVPTSSTVAPRPTSPSTRADRLTAGECQHQRSRQRRRRPRRERRQRPRQRRERGRRGGPGHADRQRRRQLAERHGGADTFDGGVGADSLDGGTERDVATYAGRGASDPVDVSLDGAANDGGTIDGNANDNVRTTVEQVIGGAGDDELTGNDVANMLTGNGGADTLTGAGGADNLFGGDGVDALAGAADRDRLDGGPGPDTLDGGSGRTRRAMRRAPRRSRSR